MNAYEKMREAFVNTLDALKSLSKSHGTDLPEDVRALLGGMAFTVNAALAAPPRNCDVGSAEEQAQRFYKFCMANSSAIRGMCDSKCPCIDSGDRCHCLTKWAQMPYEEGGKE